MEALKNYLEPHGTELIIVPDTDFLVDIVADNPAYWIVADVPLPPLDSATAISIEGQDTAQAISTVVTAMAKD